MTTEPFADGGCMCGLVRYRLEHGSDFRALLPLHKLPAGNRIEFCPQRDDRDRVRQGAAWSP